MDTHWLSPFAPLPLCPFTLCPFAADDFSAALSNLQAALPRDRLLADKAYRTAKSIATQSTLNCQKALDIAMQATKDCREAMEKFRKAMQEQRRQVSG